MNYARFERLAIGLGAAAVLGNLGVAIAANGWSDWTNLIPSLLLLPVLVVAVHSGRKAGLLAALIAASLFVAVKIPTLSTPAGVPVRDLTAIVVGVFAFGIVGIVGGEICGRIKYVFARYDHSATIDDWSRVYNQRMAWDLIQKARERFSRYAEPFAIIVISDTPAIFAGVKPARQRALVRAASNYLRGDVRMIDEVARLDDGRFLVLLPHTNREDGLVVTERLLQGMRQTLGATQDAVSAQCLTADDELELTSLAAGIADTPED